MSGSANGGDGTLEQMDYFEAWVDYTISFAAPDTNVRLTGIHQLAT